MTDGGQFVSWDRWDAEHRALAARVAELENEAETLRGAEQVHRTLEARLTELESRDREHQAADRTRRDRLWLLVLGLITGVVAPLVVTTLITFLHIRATR